MRRRNRAVPIDRGAQNSPANPAEEGDEDHAAEEVELSLDVQMPMLGKFVTRHEWASIFVSGFIVAHRFSDVFR